MKFEKGRPRPEGAGRKPGSVNKTTTQLKEAILAAAEAAGGPDGVVGYLTRLANENTGAFASLLGKVLPMTLMGDGPDGEISIRLIERRIVKKDSTAG